MTSSILMSVTPECQGRMQTPKFLILPLKIFFRFPTGYSMMDQKKVNLAVAKMKDYFLVKSSFYTPSKYLMKVKDIPNK